jgi:hypothetical protein
LFYRLDDLKGVPFRKNRILNRTFLLDYFQGKLFDMPIVFGCLQNYRLGIFTFE